MTEWAPRPLTVEVDLAHGGRWTSLRTPEREWLWRNPDPAVVRARGAVTPGAAFVDAGGVEECLPTVRGEPDHGAVWSRPWSDAGVTADGFRLQRRIRSDGTLTADYTITGRPHAPFVHAVHALLDVSPAARLEAPGVYTAYLVDQNSMVAWPAGLDRLGPDDGTAVAAVLPGCAAVTVVDGADALAFTWHAEPASLLLWRNLRGWPEGSPYRSIGIEPMAGATADLADPAAGGAAQLGPDGSFRWRLEVRAWRTESSGKPHSRPPGS
ncbi:hypothetical protein FHX44_11390 [Pseudonocardia hierapolitana]|uniref:Galactose mutarotase-like enzyme n=1 Tax=Pseudonocardia hierapolitana TaxID=1128676 RepID=A0A561SHZ9_9PSEU|nr:hypothetical protein [Pseudonocardia hierapolitana]TWF74509.1 hypothetical protein FHX44_11390 [Pseudonocardia hierapolitana]